MASAATIALAGGAASLGLYWLRRRREEAKEPPSAGWYPLVGSHFHLPEPLYLSMHERFGNAPIVRVYFGTKCVYVFNNLVALKEAMVDHAEQLSGRPKQDMVTKVFGEYGGIALTEGDVWREYRRFTLKTLRDFGFGRHGAEEIIGTETEHMMSTLDAAGGKPIETGMLMSTATSNVICQLVFGSRLADEDTRFEEMMHVFHEITQGTDANVRQSIVLSTSSLTERFPFLFTLVAKLPAAKAMMASIRKVHDFCQDQRDRHMAEMDKVDQARDYIEAHLMHQRKSPEMFTDTRLTLAVTDLFVAGTDTTANTLRWAVLFMIDNPDVSEKTHKEIVDAIGRDRLPKMQDKPSLQYSQAVIEEINRLACIGTMGILHRVTEDITVCGYRLKAESLCLFNLYSVNHDPEAFPEPKRFLPERHLKDGQFVPSPHMATFGLGKRACLGESLAKMELFIFFTALIQRYRFSLDPEEKRSMWDLLEDPTPWKGSLVRAPPVHNIVFTPWD